MSTVFYLNIFRFLIVFGACFECAVCDSSRDAPKVSIKSVDVRRTQVWGPGLRPDTIVLPVRYFFIQAHDGHGYRFNESLPHRFDIEVEGRSAQGSCRVYLEQLDRRDGSYIIRYKVPYTCHDVRIHIRYRGEHVADSPYAVARPIYSDKCKCPMASVDEWLQANECPDTYQQIENDLRPFKAVDFNAIRAKMLDKFNHPGSISICNYVIKANRIYRKCYGQHVGFNMFSDAILSALVRRVQLPNTEFFVNLGDWPLMKKGGVSRTHGPYPMFSWCGSDDTFDIVMPTYDLTESTLDAMHRVTLDILSVQRVKTLWSEKSSKAFWRGRDSRRERLDLVDIARAHPDLFNVSLTNFFFFRAEESTYGPKVPHMPFFDFFEVFGIPISESPLHQCINDNHYKFEIQFQHKYQINIDGTVAAYRFPYLLAGNSLVFKQESPFYEHFYKQLVPMKHYIPVKRDLSDLVDRIKWARKNEAKALEMVDEARKFVNENLLPTHIFCYHVKLLQVSEAIKRGKLFIPIESNLYISGMGQKC